MEVMSTTTATSKTSAARGAPDPADVSGTAAARMMFEHERLAKRLVRLSDFVSASDHVLAREEWAELEQLLVRHMEAEETFLFPAFGRENPDEARALLDEHKGLRELMDEIGLAFELHTLRAARVQELRARLEGHAAREGRTVYAWADRDENRAQARLAMLRLPGGLMPSSADGATR